MPDQPSAEQGGRPGDAPVIDEPTASRTEGNLAKRGTDSGQQLLEEPASSETGSPPKPPAHKRRDWQPLGAVRDYFNEQIKQDQGRW